MKSLFTERSLELRVALAFAAFVTLVASCTSNEPAQAPLPPANEVLSNARTAIAGVDQFEFELTHPKGKTALDGGLELAACRRLGYRSVAASRQCRGRPGTAVCQSGCGGHRGRDVDDQPCHRKLVFHTP